MRHARSQLHSTMVFLPQEHLTLSVDGAVDGPPWVVKSIGIEVIAGIFVENEDWG
jgi:hypothetical protein